MRVEIKFNQLCTIVNNRHMQLIPKNPKSSEEEPRKTLKIPDPGAKPQVWQHWQTNLKVRKE